MQPHRINSRLFLWGILGVCGLLILLTTSTFAQGGHSIFLPWITTPAIPLPNGDFESIPVIWVTLPNDIQLIYAQDEMPEGIIPHSGNHAAWLGDHGSSSQSHETEIRQTVIAPGNTPILRFWIWIHSGESCAYTKDKLLVYSNEELINEMSLCQDKNTYSWSQRILRLPLATGESATLRIVVTTENSGLFSPTSEVYLDDFIFATH